jgi:predicted nucleic-acid-binding protein
VPDRRGGESAAGLAGGLWESRGASVRGLFGGTRSRVAKAEIAVALSALLDAVELQFEDEPSVEEAVFTWKDSGAEFADCLINARHRALGCRATATFDARASKLSGFVAV